MKLLYVEDNPFDRDLTRRALLKQIPHLVWDTAGGVDEAMSKLAGQPYDVVLLDMWLQDGCGMDVLLHGCIATCAAAPSGAGGGGGHGRGG